MHQGGKRVHDPSLDRESILGGMRRQLGLTGPAVTVGAACASGNHALAQARQLAGSSAGSTLAWPARATWPSRRCRWPASATCGALSRRNADPAGGLAPLRPRPRRLRDGRGRRGVRAGERPGPARRAAPAFTPRWPASAPAATPITWSSPAPTPSRPRGAMRQALADARIDADEIDYVNAHATSTPVGDRGESRACCTLVLGDAVRTVPVSSTKSMTGHLLTRRRRRGGAWPASRPWTARRVPPTINLDDPDPECDLCHVAQPGPAGAGARGRRPTRSASAAATPAWCCARWRREASATRQQGSLLQGTFAGASG